MRPYNTRSNKENANSVAKMAVHVRVKMSKLSCEKRFTLNVASDITVAQV